MLPRNNHKILEQVPAEVETGSVSSNTIYLLSAAYHCDRDWYERNFAPHFDSSDWKAVGLLLMKFFPSSGSKNIYISVSQSELVNERGVPRRNVERLAALLRYIGMFRVESRHRKPTTYHLIEINAADVVRKIHEFYQALQERRSPWDTRYHGGAQKKKAKVIKIATPRVLTAEQAIQEQKEREIREAVTPLHQDMQATFSRWNGRKPGPFDLSTDSKYCHALYAWKLEYGHVTVLCALDEYCQTSDNRAFFEKNRSAGLKHFLKPGQGKKFLEIAKEKTRERTPEEIEADLKAEYGEGAGA